MKLSTFAEMLKREGYTPKQIMTLNHFGYECALDAHAGMENSIPDFGVHCCEIGRDFVIDNLDSLTFDENGNVTWA